MSKKFQPGAKNRQKYIYYTADGTTITIEAGENGVDEKWIAKLHELDDKEYLAAKREDYAAPVRLGKEPVDDLKNQLDQNPSLADTSLDPMEMLMKAVLEQEHAKELEKLIKALDCLTPLQKQTVYKRYYLNMTEISIALEEGVDRTAISHRLRTINEKLLKKLKKY